MKTREGLLAALLGSLRAWFRVGGVYTRIRTETEEGLRLLPLPVGLCRLGDPGEIRTPIDPITVLQIRSLFRYGADKLD